VKSNLNRGRDRIRKGKGLEEKTKNTKKKSENCSAGVTKKGNIKVLPLKFN
jgi:hypothetical protein